MSDITQTQSSWLDPEELNDVRERVPMVYVEAVPVLTDELGSITHVGLLLRMMPDGSISRAIVSGRVMHGERVRAALVRHLEKDLGPLALPEIPTSPAPFTVAEYFTDPKTSGFHDPRQHAVSLAYVVPVNGDCQPSAESLDLVWLSPAEVTAPDVILEMTVGHDRLVRRALAYGGCLP